MVRKIGYSDKPLKDYTFKADWGRHLGEGEKLLWSGVPVYGPRFTLKGIGLSLLGAIILAYGLQQAMLDPARYISGRSGAITDDEIFILLVGPYLLFGHMVFDAVKRKYTRYALTNRRAFIIKWGRLDLPDAYPIGPDTPVSIVEGRTDSVFFHSRIQTHKDGRSEVKTGFKHIRNGHEVFELLSAIKDGKFR